MLCPTKYYFAVRDRESFIGKVDEAGQNLVQVAYECLMKGIDIGRLCGVGLSGGVEIVYGLSVDAYGCSACTVRRCMGEWQLSSWK